MLLSQIIPSLYTLKILGNVSGFEEWLSRTHKNTTSSDLFHGYVFAVRCCLNTFSDGVASDQRLKIKDDFLLNRAIRELVPIEKINDTCEKTIFLKRIKKYVRRILTAKNYSELSERVAVFEKDISVAFEKIYESNVKVSSKITVDKRTALKLSLINFAHTYLVQINNGGPVANFLNPLSAKRIKEERLDLNLKGYKYAIQFLWYQILGEEVFNQTSLINLHKADSWRDYKYKKTEQDLGDSQFDFFGEGFDLREQSNLDSYFYRISNEITEPLSHQYGFQIYRINEYFQLYNYSKKAFLSNLLHKEELEDVFLKLSWEDKILNRLYWYPLEVINSRNSQMHFGIPSFNTMLAGTVSIHNKEQSEFSKVIVAKFIHPCGIDSNNFSYGILIDGISAAGHSYSGWVIYKDVCADWSGFSKSEYKTTERLIKKYKKERKIEVREMVISLMKFTEIINKYEKSTVELSIIEKNKLIPDIIQKSKAYLFELFVYYINSKYFNNDYQIRMNVHSKTGEKDIVMENDAEVILIECKINPQNVELGELLDVLEKKLLEYRQSSKSIQLWFWIKPSVKSQAIIDRRVSKFPIKTITVRDPKGEKILRNVDLSRLQFVMQDY
jgi:hypothetical protein